MKRLILGMAAVALILPAAMARANTTYDYARVIQTTPIYQSVRVSVPREDCWTERVVTQRRQGSGSYTPVVISTIVGGALGNAVGNGKSNRRIGTAVGAVLGHSVGRDIVRHNSGPVVEHHENVRRCQVVNEYHNEENLVGYNVRYRYHGEEYTVRMNHDPGDRIQVRVRVEPLR
jgi:uncharacterized protein YcfJ